MCIVTVSRGSFGGAKHVAEGVARRLDVPCVSREILAEAADAAGIPTKRFSEVLDRSPSLFERLSSERDTYLVFVRAALCGHAAAGSFVYHGHDGHLLLDLPNVLRVRVVAPLEQRIENVRASLDLDERGARRHIARIDTHRARWTKFLYGVSWEDPLLYDLILNLERVDVERGADLVTDLAREERFAWTDGLRRRAAGLALCGRVWSELARVPETRGADLEIDAEDGVVVIRGHARSAELRRMVMEAAARVTEAEEIRCEIALPSDAWKP